MMSSTENRYSFSFIAGGLLMNEMTAVAERFLESASWQDVAARAETENLLRARTVSSGRRVLAEVRNRMEVLSRQQIGLLVNGVASDQVAVAWLAICKAYLIVREFAEEVVRERFVTLAMTVDGSDFDRFLDAKAAWEPRLESLTDSTLEKARTVVMRMLREAGIISDQGFIQPTLLSPELVSAIQSDDASLYRVFPISDQDFARASA
jgi:hypothetical protein